MKKILTASLVLAFSMPSLSVAAPLGSAVHISRPWHGCHKRYTPRMAERAALRIYAGSLVSHRALLHLGWYERCLVSGANRAAVRSFNHHQAEMWRERQTPPVSGATGGWVIPQAIVMCESGGRNLPPNSAGASGYYQDIRSTWNHYGGYSDAYLAPKSVQDSFNAQLWAGGSGASNWVCKA